MDQVSLDATNFRAVTTHAANFVKAGEGISLWVFGVLVTIKALGNETGGSYSLFEHVVDPGMGPPEHMHTREDESCYVLEGEVVWKVGDKEITVTKGSFIHLPRFLPHTFVNRSNTTAHMVLTYAPAGYEGWFIEVGKKVKSLSEAAPEITKEEVAHAGKLGEEYGTIYYGVDLS